MEGKQALVVDTVNKLNLSSNAKQKVQHLEQLEELLLRNEPSLLDGVLSELVPLQMDKAVSVRRKLLEFVTAAASKRPSAAVLSTAAPCIATLLADEHVLLAKEAARSAHTLLNLGLTLLCSSPQVDAAAAAWASVQALQHNLSSKATSLSGSHGGTSSRQLAMCLAGIKMAEQAALQFTTESASQLPVALALEAEAKQLVQNLVQLLATATVKQRAGPVVIAVVKSLGQCCLHRPQMLPVLLPPLLALAQQGLFKAAQPDDQQTGVEASCGAALKDVLIRVYRSSTEASVPWRPQLHQALVVMGAEAAAAATQRHLDRQAVRASHAHKRKAAEQAGRDPKVPRPGTPAGGADSAYSTPARTPTPQPDPAASAGGGGVGLPAQLRSLFRPESNVEDMEKQLDGAQQVLEVLVRANQQAAVEVIMATIAPDVLAELVSRWMDNLPLEPPQAAAPPQPAPATSAAAPASTTAVPLPPLSAGPLPQGLVINTASLAQYLKQHHQQQTAAAASDQHQILQAPVQPSEQQQRQQQQQQQDPRQRAAARNLAAKAAAAAAASQVTASTEAGTAVPPAQVAPSLPRPLPVSLKPEQVKGMHTAAVQRILDATDNKPIRNFRELLLSRLASRSSDGQTLTDLMLQHVLCDYHRHRGHLLLVRWLYALVVSLTTEARRRQLQQLPEAEINIIHNTGEDVLMMEAPAGSAAASTEAAPFDQVAAAAAAAPQSAEASAFAAAGDESKLQAVSGGVETSSSCDAEGQVSAHTPADMGSPASQQLQHQHTQQSTAPEDRSQQDLQHDGQDVGLQQQQQHPVDGSIQVQHNTANGTLPHIQNSMKHCSSSSGSDTLQADLSGTVYEAVLMASLKGLREQLPATDLAIPQLLQDAPVLPWAAVTQYLQGLIAEGSDWASTGLHTVCGLFEAQPGSRKLLLQLLLDATVSADSGTRDKAVRLLVSKLAAWKGHAAAVLEFATQHLLLLLQASIPVNKQQQQQMQAAGPDDLSAAAAPMAVDTDDDGAAQPSLDDETCVGAAGAEEQEQPMDTDTAVQHSMLYLALCTRNPELLQLLLETYGKAGPESRAALTRYAPSLAAILGPTEPKLLELIRQPPEGSEELLTTMLTTLADHQLPPEPLCQACMTHYESTGSVSFLGSVVVSLSKHQVIKLLPKLLLQLPDKQLRVLYRRLAVASHGKEPHFAPVELLVLLHKVTSDMPDFKKNTAQIIAAVDRAMRTPEVFPAAVMQTAISRMEAMAPPPRLFMRSVTIMVTNAAAPLIKWVINLLERLIQKQLWRNQAQWKGFLVCCEKLQDHGSATVLLQLPNNVLESALEQMPRSIWKKLHDVATAPNCPVVLYKEVRQTVDKFQEKWVKAEIQHKQQEVAARQAAVNAAAAAMGSVGTPVTPGNKAKGSRTAQGPAAGPPASAAKTQPPLSTATVAGTAAADGTDTSTAAAQQPQQQQPVTSSAPVRAAETEDIQPVAGAPDGEMGQPSMQVTADEVPEQGAEVDATGQQDEDECVLDFEDDDDEDEDD